MLKSDHARKSLLLPVAEQEASMRRRVRFLSCKDIDDETLTVISCSSRRYDDDFTMPFALPVLHLFESNVFGLIGQTLRLVT